MPPRGRETNVIDVGIPREKVLAIAGTCDSRKQKKLKISIVGGKNRSGGGGGGVVGGGGGVGGGGVGFFGVRSKGEKKTPQFSVWGGSIRPMRNQGKRLITHPPTGGCLTNYIKLPQALREKSSKKSVRGSRGPGGAVQRR